MKISNYESMERRDRVCSARSKDGWGRPCLRGDKTLSLEFGSLRRSGFMRRCRGCPWQRGSYNPVGSVLRIGVKWWCADEPISPPEDVPVKSVFGPVVDKSMTKWVIGRIAVDDPAGDAFGPNLAEAWSGVPLNVHPHQEPVPASKVDQWEYATWKRMAMQFGRVWDRSRGLLWRAASFRPAWGVLHPRCLPSTGRSSWTCVCGHLDGMPPRFG